MRPKIRLHILRWIGAGVAAALLAPGAGWSGGAPVRSRSAGSVLREQFTMAAAPGGAFAVSPDGRWMAAVEDDGSISVVDGVTGSPVRSIASSDSSAPTRLCFTADGRLLAGSMADAAVIWDVSTGSAVRLPAPGAESLAFSPDATVLAVGGGSSTMDITLFDARSGAPLRKWTAGPPAYGGVYNLAFAPDGREIFSGQGQEPAKEWDSATGALIRILPGDLPYWNRVQAPAISPDGRYLALKAGRDCVVVDVSSGSVVRKVAQGSNGEPLAFSADGSELTVLMDSASSEAGPRRHEVKDYNLQSGKVVRTMPLGTYQGFAVAPVLLNSRSGVLVREQGGNEILVAALAE